MIEDAVINNKFLESKEFNEWHDSLSDLLNFFKEVFKPELSLKLIKRIKKEQWSIK